MKTVFVGVVLFQTLFATAIPGAIITSGTLQHLDQGTSDYSSVLTISGSGFSTTMGLRTLGYAMPRTDFEYAFGSSFSFDVPLRPNEIGEFGAGPFAPRPSGYVDTFEFNGITYSQQNSYTFGSFAGFNLSEGGPQSGARRSDLRIQGTITFPELSPSQPMGTSVRTTVTGTFTLTGSLCGWQVSRTPALPFAPAQVMPCLFDAPSIYGTGTVQQSVDVFRFESPNGGYVKPRGWTFTFSEISEIPEPSTYATFALGLASLAFWGKGRKGKP